MRKSVIALSIALIFAAAANAPAYERGAIFYHSSQGDLIYGRTSVLELPCSVIKAVFGELKSGHVGLYIGDGKIIHAVRAGVIETTSENFMTKEDIDGGAKFMGAKVPADYADKAKWPDERKDQLMLIAKEQVEKWYDLTFHKQTGAGSGDFTCVGLVEYVYEMAGYDITPQGYYQGGPGGKTDTQIYNCLETGFSDWEGVNTFAETVQFSKFSHPLEYLAGLEHEGSKYMFFPYTQYIQATTINLYEDPVIVTTQLPQTVRGEVYSQAIEASGGTTPYNWSVVEGTLPEGLALDPETGHVSGIVNSAAQNSTFTIRVTDSGSPTGWDEKQFEIQVLDPVSIITNDLDYAFQKVSYSFAFQGEGGVLPYHWTIQNGVLPQGLFLNEETGVISGTPSLCGYFDLSIQLSDSANEPHSDTKAFTLEVLCIDYLDISGNTGGLPQVLVSLTGPVSRTALSDAGGNYRFMNLPKGSYTVIPQAKERFFEPESRSINLVDRDLTGVDFSTCAFLPVRILGNTPEYFGTIAAAYSAAVNGEIIQCQKGYFAEHLTLNRDVKVTLEGGFSCNYGSRSGGSSVSSLTVTDGTVVLSDIFLGGPQATVAAAKETVFSDISSSASYPPSWTTGYIPKLGSVEQELMELLGKQISKTIAGYGVENAYDTESRNILRELIHHFYRSFLARAPEPGAVNLWLYGFLPIADELGVDTRCMIAQMARIIFLSNEYNARKREPQEIIGDLASAFLRRAPTLEEMALLLPWTWHRSGLVTVAAGSQDFKALIDEHFLPVSENEARRLVFEWYSAITDKLPEGDMLDSWGRSLEGTGFHREEALQVLEAIANTSALQSVDAEDSIVRLYTALTKGFPDKDSLSRAATELRRGEKTLPEIIGGMLQ